MIKDYYKILGLKNDANFVQIRHKYIKKVMPCHPDRNPERINEFYEINEAFYVLSYKEYHWMYDRFCRRQIKKDDDKLTEKYIIKTTRRWHQRSLKKSYKFGSIS